MIGNNKLFILLLLCIFSYTMQGNGNWTMGDNETTIHSYVSSLTEEQRDKYYYWIGLRNSFYFSGNLNQLEKLVKYFTPEEEKYYSDLYNFSLPCMICAGAIFLCTIVFLFQRCICHGCKGPKIIEQTYINTTYFILIAGAIIGLVCMIISLYNAAKSK